MLKAPLIAVVAVAALVSGSPALTQTAPERTWTRANDVRRIDFPATAQGEAVLAIDTHTHTAFSDGVVWPTFRLWEAEQDHLAAYAVTDHLEVQRYKDDIRIGDHNRPYAIALEEAKRIASRVQPIPGTEITRDLPWGHFNALFLRDANAIPNNGTMEGDPRPALKAARGQGAFLIWNHAWVFPGLEGAGADQIPSRHRALLAEGLIDGMEIANSLQYSAEAFDVALKNDLAVIGASDVHTAIDVDSQVPEGQHRTATLVIAKDASLPALREALQRKRTAALFRQSLYGRERELAEIVGGAVRIASRKRAQSFLAKDLVEIELANDAFMPFQLRFVSAAPLTTPRVVTVPARGALTIQFINVADMEAFAPRVEVLNAFVDPRTNLALTLR